MKCKVVGRVFDVAGKQIPIGTEVERKSADGVIYQKLEVATPKPAPKRKPKAKSEDEKPSE